MDSTIRRTLWGAFAVLTLLVAIGLALTWVPHAWQKLAVPATVLAVVIAYPYYVSHLFTIPLFGAFPSVRTGVVMLVFVMMALGLNVVVGYAGLLDLGYVAFYAMGAYTVAWFASLQFAHHKLHFGAVGVGSNLPGFHVSIWLLLVAAGILTAITGVIIGLPTLRLRGDYLAIVTLGFGEILPQIARNGDSLFGTGFNLTNGPNGITPIDPPGFGNTLHNATGGILPSNYLTDTHADRLYFWTGLVLVLITVFSSWRLRDSRLGPPMVARALAIVHTCMYDAWAAYDRAAVGTRLGGGLRRPHGQRTLPNKVRAISFAAPDPDQFGRPKSDQFGRLVPDHLRRPLTDGLVGETHLQGADVVLGIDFMQRVKLRRDADGRWDMVPRN